MSEDDSWDYTPKTDQEIRQLALDYDAGRIFLATDEEKIRLSFMTVLAFMRQEHIEHMKKNDVVAFYEHIKDALSRSINGLPMFSTARMLSREEMERFSKAYDEVKLFREKFVEGQDANG